MNVSSFLSLFSKKPVPPVERNFDNVPWKWRDYPAGGVKYHLWAFINGLGVIVFNKSRNTFDGMEAHAIHGYTPETGGYKQWGVPDLRIYTSQYGIGVEEVLSLVDQIRSLKHWKNDTQN